MKAVAFLIALSLICGCASFTKPDNEIRVTEYGADGSYLMQASGAIGGCRLIEMGAAKSCLRYTGKSCSVESDACRRTP